MVPKSFSRCVLTILIGLWIFTGDHGEQAQQQSQQLQPQPLQQQEVSEAANGQGLVESDLGLRYAFLAAGIISSGLPQSLTSKINYNGLRTGAPTLE
jgi:hypothetical protein